MNFDFNKTIALIKDGLTEPQTTWKNYLETSPDWQATAITLTGPLLLANVILGVILGRLTGGFSAYGYHSSFISALFWGLFLSIAGFLIAVVVYNFMAGIFKGKSDFSRAFAAVSLAAIPAWIAGIIAALIPGFIGSMVALAGGIISLVFMYKILPLALGVPSEKRVLHFIASLVIIIIFNMVVGMIFGGASAVSHMDEYELSSKSSNTESGTGMFSAITRQAKITQAAEKDRFDPPADGEISKSQMRTLLKVMTKTRALQADYASKAEAIGKELEDKEKNGGSISLSDMTKAYNGMGSIFNAVNVEMEIVKTSGGNWAEHNWVKNQLRTAYVQQGEGSDAIEHNYKLYEQYKEELGEL